VKNRVAAKNVTFKLRDVQQLAEENFAAVTEKEWAAVCRHVKAVEEEYMNKQHKIDGAMERIIINPDDDDDDDTSESSDDCDDEDMIAVGPLSGDSK
jgi:dipeptidase